MKMTKTTFAGVWNSDFIGHQRASGLPQRWLIRNALRNSLPPIITLVGFFVGFCSGPLCWSKRSSPGAGLANMPCNPCNIPTIPRCRGLSSWLPPSSSSSIWWSMFSTKSRPPDQRRERHVQGHRHFLKFTTRRPRRLSASPSCSCNWPPSSSRRGSPRILRSRPIRLASLQPPSADTGSAPTSRNGHLFPHHFCDPDQSSDLGDRRCRRLLIGVPVGLLVGFIEAGPAHSSCGYSISSSPFRSLCSAWRWCR